MRKCKVMDCQFVDRATCLCTEPFIDVDGKAQCVTYRQDKKYLDLLLHQSIHGGTRNL